LSNHFSKILLPANVLFYPTIWTLIFQAIREAEKHLEVVKSERSYYKSLCKITADTLKAYFGDDLQRLPSPGAKVPANTHNIMVHYSFDMAQQVKT